MCKGVSQEMIEFVDFAEREKMLIKNSNYNLTFTPAQLRAEWSKGKFRWSKDNWVLLDLHDAVAEQEQQRRTLEGQLQQIKIVISSWREYAEAE